MKLLNFLTQSSSKEDVEESLDYTSLQKLFTELTAHKDDSQQRGWALHEDESIIASILEEILSILVSEPFSCYSQEVMITFDLSAKVAFIGLLIYFIGPDKQNIFVHKNANIFLYYVFWVLTETVLLNTHYICFG